MKPESGPGRDLSMKQMLAIILVGGLALRLLLAPLFSFNIDITYWMKVFNLIDSGSNLYGMDGYYYAPIWGYVLGLMDLLAHLFGITDYGTLVPEMYPYIGRDYSISEYVTSVGFNFIVKLPLILTDIATGYLLYAFVRRIADAKKAIIACALWVFCPLTILESSIHGMFDCMSAMFMLMAFIAAYDRRYILAGAAFSLAILTKFFPIFLTFLMFAIVFRNEGLHNRAFRKSGLAVASAVITMIIVELPAIVHGQFWDSLHFLLVRVGLSANLMDSIMGPLAYIIVAVFVLLVCWVIHYFCRVRPDIVRSRFVDITREERERLVRKMAKIAAIVFTVLIVIYAAVTMILEGSFDIVGFFETLAQRIVLLLSAYTLILEAYIAYRYLFTQKEGDAPLMTAFMLSSTLIFLWPPSPQYMVVVIPAMILYAVIARPGFAKPLLVMATALAVYDLVLAGPSTLFSLAVYTDIISLSSIMPMVDAITSYIGPIPTIAPFMLVFGGFAYLCMINALLNWYKHRRDAQ